MLVLFIFLCCKQQKGATNLSLVEMNASVTTVVRKNGDKKEKVHRSVLQIKLAKLALQIGYGGTQKSLKKKRDDN